MKMLNSYRMVTFIALLAVLSFAPSAMAQQNQNGEQAFDVSGVAGLTGFEEVPTVYSPGTGLFEATFDRSERTIDYRLIYDNLTGNATAAHIHLGRPGIAGGVLLPLCGSGDTDACPGRSGTVSGTLSADDIMEPVSPMNDISQGIQSGEYDKLLAAVLADATYVNVHTPDFPEGEIRGQIKATVITDGTDDDSSQNGTNGTSPVESP